MIRFSAALVAVAIGLLIGGVAASELLLVYIAIVVSAVALVALATGVVLKREELFGEGHGLATATAGASPLWRVRVGASHDKDRPETRVTPPPLQGTAVGPGAAFAGNTLAASPQSAVPWETQASLNPWPPTAPTTPAAASAWTPAAQDESPGNGAGTGADSRAASAWQPTAPSGGTPWAWATPSPSVTPGAGSGSAPPSWFDRMGKLASADPPATPSASGNGNGNGRSSGGGTAALEDAGKADDTAADTTATPVDAVTAVDEDDDWPTRYSWLDDEPANGEASDDADPASAAALAAEPGTSGTSGDFGTPDTLDTGTPEVMASGPGDADAAENAGADAAPPAADAAPGTGLVAVIRGVPRYHDPECVLIRFMPEADSQKLSVAQAKEAGCTPCAACQPEG